MPNKNSKSIDGLNRRSDKPAAKKPAAKKTAAKNTTAKKPVAKRATKSVSSKRPTSTGAIAVEVRHGEKPANAPEPITAQEALADVGYESDEPSYAADFDEPELVPKAENDDILNELNRLEESEPVGAPEEIPELSEEKKIEKKVTKKRSLASKIISWILVAAEAICGGLLIYAVLRANIVPEWELYIAIVVMALLFLFTARKLTKRRAFPATRIICGILAFILAFAYGAGFYYVYGVVGFLENITSADNTEHIEYSVVAYKDSGYSKLAQLSGKGVGFQSGDLHLKEAQAKLKESISYEAKEEDDLASLFVDLDKKDIAGIVFVSSYMEILHEDNEEYYNRLKTISTFEIEVEKAEEKTSNVNIKNEPFILYISGTDSRNGVRSTARSDVNMLAVVNPSQSKILLVSVPRDYYVQLHGTTGRKDKLTHAGIFGIEMSKNTMADLFNVEIAHTVKVSFTTVEKLVDAVDGIDIYSDQSFTAWTDRSCHIPKGNIHLGGRCALAFARERMSYASGDRHRVQNQQDVLTAILKKATSIKYIVSYPRLLSAIEGTFQTSLSYDEITGFAKMQLNSLKSWQVESISVDGKGSTQPTYSMGSQPLYVMIPDQKTVDAAKEKIQEYLK